MSVARFPTMRVLVKTNTDITSLVADVNVNEIADHIRNGNLASWVESWQQQMAFELENLKLSEKD